MLNKMETRSRRGASVPSLRALSPASPDAATIPGETPTHVRTTNMDIKVTPYSTAGQFALAPATQQTTVVTTTTTTVNLAPFILQPPKHLSERDPKQYPLAYSPTPANMKNIRFDMGGRATTFMEAQDSDVFIGKHEQQQRLIEENNGILREYVSSHPSHNSAVVGSILPGMRRTSNPMYRDTQSATPPSLAAAAELAESQRRKGKRKLLNPDTHDVDSEAHRSSRRLRLSAAKADGRVSPFTPNTSNDFTRRLHGSLHASLKSSQEGLAQSQITQQLRSPRRPISRRRHQSPEAENPTAVGLIAATPPIMDSDVEADLPPSQTLDHHPNRPSMLHLGSQQDVSLPSPSLSPVTAAANMRQRQLLSRRHTDNDDVSDLSGLENEPSASVRRKLPPMFNAESTSIMDKLTNDDDLASLEQDAVKQPTLMDVPEMISMFDALPVEMQSYVMFQLLKRSNKRTLRTVAEVIGPALKCDPFDTLPVELSLKVTKYLDAVSLARAAQVSKRWRHLVNSDETTWKELIVREGFDLSDGEIERAVRQGWGWQFPTQNEYERDLSGCRRSSRASARGSESMATRSNDTDDDTSSTTLRSTRKRKAAAALTSAKRQKRKASTPHEEDVRWMRDLQEGQGPIAYASAAAAAVPDPKIGLPSLKSLHLFKSIYQRHHMMRQTWMNGDTEPRHLAFRAHHRHVVTCLIFFNDRIITGSDDTSINIFDLRTGILRKRLEGHEGGVWALSCDGDTLVSGSTDRSVRVWNMNTGQCMQTFQGHTSTVRCLVILKPTKTGEDADGNAIMHPTEPIIITGSRDSTLRVWKLPGPDSPPMHQAGPPENEGDNQYAVRTLTGHHNSVRAIAAYGDTLVSGSYDCRVYVWKISTGELVHRLQGHSQKVYSVVLDHERNRCISGSMDNLVKVWSLDTGTCLFTLEGHTSLVGLLELSHENLVSAAADSTLRVWDPETGACRSTLSAHTGAITCFQHDGSKVISGSDRTLKMWDIKTGEVVRDLLTDLSGVWQVRFDERRCVAAVQRNNLTYIEVLDFGASRDGVPAADRGRRIVVDARGREVQDDDNSIVDLTVGGP